MSCASVGLTAVWRQLEVKRNFRDVSFVVSKDTEKAEARKIEEAIKHVDQAKLEGETKRCAVEW